MGPHGMISCLCCEKSMSPPRRGKKMEEVLMSLEMNYNRKGK